MDWGERVRSNPGQFYGWTTTGENGLGVGVHSRAATANHIVSLFHIKTREENEVKFSGRAHLEEYLDIPEPHLESWIAFIADLDPRRRRIADRDYAVVPLPRVEENIEVLLERMRPLMGVDHSAHSHNP